MKLPLSNPGFLSSRDPFCDGVMRSLICAGRAPRPISMRKLSFRITRRAFADVRELTRPATAPTPLQPLKLLSAAARHAAITASLQRRRIDVLYVWRGLLGRSAVGASAAQRAGIPCVFFERGPLPGWLQIDMKGVNARSSIPRDPGFFRRWRAQYQGPMLDWRSLRETLTARTPRRDLVSQTPRADWSGEDAFLFCPFQINMAGDPLPDAGWVTDAAVLVAALAQASHALPEGWHLRLKPHPNARGDLADLVSRHPGARLRIDRDTNSLDQLQASQGVITVNSAMGLEAFFFDKPVITLGDSYYVGLGRTTTARSTEELSALLADPAILGFDPQARDDLMSFLFNDFLVRDQALREGRFDMTALLDRHARHQALVSPSSQFQT